MEVDHLEELKLQNMKSVIQAIREELADYWDKCFYGQKQREDFSPYYDGGCWLFLLADSPVGAAGCREGLPSAHRGLPRWDVGWRRSSTGWGLHKGLHRGLHEGSWGVQHC